MDVITTERLLHRIDRLYSAIGKTIVECVVSGNNGETLVHGRLEPLANGNLAFRFGKPISQAQIENIAWDTIHNVATFYEFVETWAATNNVPHHEVAKVRKDSRPIRIIEDLDNLEKHQKNQPNQSKVSPKLVRICCPIIFDGRMTLEATSGSAVVARGAQTRLEIFGEILNSTTGNLIGTFPDVMDQAIKAWEKFLTAKGIFTPESSV